MNLVPRIEGTMDAQTKRDKLSKLVGEHVNVQYTGERWGGILTATGYDDMFRIVAGLDYRVILCCNISDIVDNLIFTK